MQKVFFEGTHRVRTPQETFAALEPLLADYGITRLADVTGLDVLGIPVVMAVRPLATTLTVSQGKGTSLLLAKVSAAMESIELWHAENAVPAPQVADTPAAALPLPYPVTALDWPGGNLLTEDTPLDWIEARSLPHDVPVPVPTASVQMGHPPTGWRPPGLATSSNGLASGNSVAEATVHALCEVIERDAMAALQNVPAGLRRYVEPESVDDPQCAAYIQTITRAGAWLEIEQAPSRFGIPCLVVRVWLEDTASSITFGSGAHCDPAIALSRALTEAAQSRLTGIVGTRDDIRSSMYLGIHFPRPTTCAPRVTWQEVVGGRPARYFADHADEADWLAGQVSAVTSFDPLRVVLADREELAVVKVICPGTRGAAHEDHRPGFAVESEAAA